MRKVIFVATLTMLIVLQTMSADVSAETRCRRYYKHPGTPAEFATIVRRALAVDPTGLTRIDAKRCDAKDDRSCGTVQALLTDIRRSDPRGTVNGVPLNTVDQVPAFLSKLVKGTPPKGKFWMSGMVKRGSGWEPLWNCASREFKKGEMAWIDPDTEVTVLADDCGNPVGQRESEDCVYIGVPSLADDEIRLKLYNVPYSTCTGLKRAGESDFEAPDVERCPDGNCAFLGADAVMGTSKGPVGSFSNEVDGMTVVRLPVSCAEEGTDCRVFFCRRLPDGEETCGVGVQWFDYVERKVAYLPRGSKMVAEIRYDEAAAGQLTTREEKPSRLWWNFNHADCSW